MRERSSPAAGMLMFVSARGGSPRLGVVAAGVASLGALSLDLPLGFSDPVLGGTATSAAFLLCVAAVAAQTRVPHGSPQGR